MQNFLTGYHLSDPTWLYLSFVLILAVYFKFSRLWSLRNFDLLLLLSISPGVLLQRSEDPLLASRGTWWLFGASGLALLRVLGDGLFVRRPRLEQNMNAAGMSFLCAATVIFLTTKLLSDPLQDETARALTRAGGQRPYPTVKAGEAPAVPDEPDLPEETPASGPTTALVKRAVDEISRAVAAHQSKSLHQQGDVETYIVRGIAILSHLAVIIGLTLVGRRIYGDPDLGFAMSSLYILMPCTAYDLGSVTQVLPAALIVWAIFCYRWPFASGSLLGLASGIVFFPVFLLPLWASFYGRRGAGRFVTAVLLTAGLVLGALAVLSRGSEDLFQSTLGYMRWTNISHWTDPQGGGLWNDDEAPYRLPILVSYVLLLIVVTAWPRQKSLAQLIPQSGAIVLGAQFWYPHPGGVYVLWFLPLLLLAAFRPMMTNHFAPEIQPWTLFGRRRTAIPPEIVEMSRI